MEIIVEIRQQICQTIWTIYTNINLKLFSGAIEFTKSYVRPV